MTPIHDSQIVHPSVWKTADIPSKDTIAVDLDTADLAELERTMQTIDRSKPATGVQARDVHMPRVAERLARVRHELRDGRGIVLVRRLPVERYSYAEAELAYWLLGLQLGVAVSQSKRGDRIGHVRNEGASAEGAHARAYRSNAAQAYHTDVPDILSLFCVAKAKSGGESMFCSALHVHNELQAQSPLHLKLLYEGFQFHRRGEERPGDLPYTPHRVPMFWFKDGKVGSRYLPRMAKAGPEVTGVPLTPAQLEALDAFNRIATREDVTLTFMLEPGEIIFVNNYTVCHGRAAFTDDSDERERRHLLRLWLEVDDFYPIVPEIHIWGGGDGRGGIAFDDVEPQPAQVAGD